jgi:hypothetical protein
MNIASAATQMQQSSDRQALQMTLLKKQHNLDMAMVKMIDEVAHSAPPPGQGGRVDIKA